MGAAIRMRRLARDISMLCVCLPLTVPVLPALRST